MGQERIKLRILVPLTIAIVGLMGAFVTGSFRLMNGALNDEVNRYLLSVKKTLRAKHHSDIEALSRAAESIKQIPDLESAWRTGNRNDLLSILQPAYRDLAGTYHVTHLAVHTKDGTNFLRVNEPGRFGDVVTHATFRKARDKSQLFFGMELTNGGTFVLSLVAPWHVKNQLMGYIELEKELRYITRDVPMAMGVELVSVIDKRFIDRKSWERNYRSAEHTSPWDSFTDFVIIDNTFEATPNELEQLLSVRHQDHQGNSLEIEHDEKTYCAAFFPLVDVENRDVGDIVVFYDATVPMKRTANLLVFICSMCALIGLALFVSFYKMLDSLEKELTESRQQLLKESQLRLEVEKKHAKELAAHVLELEMERAKQRTLAQRIADNQPQSQPPV